jgi:hypothetical protein
LAALRVARLGFKFTMLAAASGYFGDRARSVQFRVAARFPCQRCSGIQAPARRIGASRFRVKPPGDVKLPCGTHGPASGFLPSNEPAQRKFIPLVTFLSALWSITSMLDCGSAAYPSAWTPSRKGGSNQCLEETTACQKSTKATRCTTNKKMHNEPLLNMSSDFSICRPIFCDQIWRMKTPQGPG